MSKRPYHILFSTLSLTLIVMMVAGILPVTAGPAAAPRLQEGGWLPFGPITEPAEPTLTVLASDAGRVDLLADLAGCTAEAIRVNDRSFTLLGGRGYGHGTAVGFPDLPVLRRDVEVPVGAQVSLEWLDAAYVELSLSELGLEPIYPLQPSVPKWPGAQERAPFVIDEAFYAGGSRFPDTPAALGESYVVRGHRVQTVEIWPVAYDPGAGTVRLYRQVTLRLRLEGSDMARTENLAERLASPAFESRLARHILNYNQGAGPHSFAPDAEIGYLIITADPYYDAMLPFVALRDSRGFDVTMTRLSEVPGGGSNQDILDYIETAYWTWPVPPSYVLLVGDADVLPGWDSVSAGQITDLYYGCMDGPGDWHPDIGRGRFPVDSPAQTTIMVDKYLAYASLTGQEPWLKSAAFIATCDQYLVAEGTHNYVIQTHTAPNGYWGTFPTDPMPGGDRLYCVTHDATDTDIQAALNQGRWAAIYSGHGSHTGWEMNYGQDDVQNLVNYGMFPFVASHACITGDFALPEVYGETWVLQENTAALVFWGSSDSSYWDEDDVLERVMFDSLFTELLAYPTVAQMTDDGLAGVEQSYPSSARYYWETYNILGDPALRVFMEPDLPTFYLEVEPSEHQVCSSGTVTSSVIVGSVQNYSETVYLSTGPLPAGVSASIVPPSAQAPYTAVLTLDVAPSTLSGEYTIILTGTDQVSWTQEAAVQLRVDDSAPAVPTLLDPPNGAVDVPRRDILFQWGEDPLAASYHLQVDDDPAFGSPELDLSGIQSSSYALAGPLEPSTPYFWRARASNGCGQSAFSSIYVFTTEAIGCIVLVDDDGDNPDVLSYYTDALDELGLTYDVWDLAASGDPASGDLSGYQAVVWFTGYPYGNTFNNDNEAAVGAYLDGGGNFLLSSQDYLYDFGLTPFGQTYLHIASFDSDVGQTTVTGQNPYSGLGPYSLSYPFYNYSDVVSPDGQGMVAFTGNAGNAAVAYEGASFNTVFLGFPFEAIPNLADRSDVMAATVDLFGGCVCDPVQQATFSWAPITPTVGQEIAFYGTADGDPPHAYQWDLGDGSAAAGGAVTHTYDLAGDYTVVLTVTNCETGTATVSHVVTVLPCDPVSDLDFSWSPLSPTLGEEVTFSAEASGTTPISFSWSFGDGGSATGQTVAHTYAATGTYEVVLAAVNACGDGTVLHSVPVTAEAPHGTFTSNSPVILGQPMLFTATVSGTAPLSYSWDFGDGAGTGYGSHAVYTYTQVGEYLVELAVSGPGGTAVISGTVAVLPQEVNYRIYLPMVLKEAP